MSKDINDSIQGGINHLDEHYPWVGIVVWLLLLPFWALPFFFTWLYIGVFRGKWHPRHFFEESTR